MIRNFADREAAQIWEGVRSRRLPPEIQATALRKLRMLNNAQHLGDLMIPPGNRLEKLSGNRQGWFSIRVNAQWRICFRWHDGGAEDVQIVDYH